MAIDPLTKGKIRSGRDDGRPTQSDIAVERQAKPPLADEDKLQIPKPNDPGHTA